MSKRDQRKMKISRSPWLKFYLCESCGACAEKSELRNQEGPCPDCGGDTLSFGSARWRIEEERLGFFANLMVALSIMDPPKATFIPEFREGERLGADDRVDDLQWQCESYFNQQWVDVSPSGAAEVEAAGGSVRGIRIVATTTKEPTR